MNPHTLPPPPLRYRAMEAVLWPLLKLAGMTCRDAYRLSSERMDGPLRRADSLRLRIHLLMCGICRRLPAQFANLRSLLRRCHHEDHPDPAESAALPHDARERIEKHLDGFRHG